MEKARNAPARQITDNRDQISDRKNQISDEDNDNDKNKDNDKYNDNEKDNSLSFLPSHMGSSAEKPVVLNQEKEKEKETGSAGEGSRLAAEKREMHPSLEEVMDYIQYSHLPVDGEHFYNYYKANGWHMGQQPIRDWKAALRAWARNAPVKPRPPEREPRPGSLEAFQSAFEMARMLDAKSVQGGEARDAGDDLLSLL